MKKISRILSASLAAASAVFPVYSFVETVAFAEDTLYTFDGKYKLTDLVQTSLLEIEGDTSGTTYNLLREKIRKACGKNTWESITFADLKKISSLDFSNIGLQSLPSAINYMTGLTSLNLSHNLLRYENVTNINLEGCTKLRNLNLSYNYLTRVPAWYINDSITTRNIDYNLLNNDKQRSIKVTSPTYYFMAGDKIEQNALKNKILSTVRLDDNSLLPDFLYNADKPPYNELNDEEKDPKYDYALHIEDWGLDGKLTDGKVTLSGSYDTVEVTVRLYNDSNNDNTKATVTIYLLDGSDPSTVKVRLEGLLDECDKLTKTDYTQSSWTNLESVKKTSQAIFDYTGADSDMLRTALSQLVSAKNALVEGVDPDTKKVLTSLSSIGASYKEDDYTPSSWKTFSSALEEVKKLSSDADATLLQAKAAIKSFQQAQAGLVSSVLQVPSKAPKTDFEKIFGESKTVSYSGVTKNGRKYRWSFNGKNITEPKEFNPEVSDIPADEAAMIAEAGSVGKYFGFSTAQTGELPGKATLSIGVSDKFANGDYYLYKWESASGGRLAGTVKVSSQNAQVTISEGGTYYISPVLQRFALESSKYIVDEQNGTVKIPLTKSCKVSNLRSGFKYGSSLVIKTASGAKASDTVSVKTGMTVAAPNDKEYSLVVIGDIDASGQIDARDASVLLKYLVSGSADANVDLCGDTNNDGSVNAKDAVQILKMLL